VRRDTQLALAGWVDTHPAVEQVSDLSFDLERLRMIRTYLPLQPTAADARIAQAEKPAAPPQMRQPVQALRLQPSPAVTSMAGAVWCTVTHAASDVAAGSTERKQEMTLALPEVMACSTCHRQMRLGTMKGQASTALSFTLEMRSVGRPTPPQGD
jgi:hypothetical protein